MTFSPIIKKSFGPKREQTITTICSFARISGDCILIEASFEQMVIGEIVDLQQNAFQIISNTDYTSLVSMDTFCAKNGVHAALIGVILQIVDIGAIYMPINDFV